MNKVILICGVLILGLNLFSCAQDTVNDKELTAKNSEETIFDDETNKTEEILKPDVPNETFDGYEFKILNITPSSMHWATHILTVEQQNGEVLNDSVYNRNLKVEETLHTKIIDNQVSSGEITEMIKRSVSADDDDYDAAMLSLSSQGDLGVSGYLTDWNTIPYIDLEKPWWSQSTNSDISLNGKLFMAAGDIGLAYYDAVMPIIMNLGMVEDFQLDNPYELVLSGRWIADKVKELMIKVTADLDGDGKYTSVDRFGMFGMSEEYFALIAAFNEKVFKKNQEDIPYLAINTESFQKVFDKAISIMNNDDVFLNYRLQKFGDTSGISLMNVFTDGRALFYSDVLYHLSALRDMEDDFAILPRAKFDENQIEHYSYIHQSAVLMLIPSNVKNLERTGIILESLAAESKYTVIKTYYDLVLSQKYARDEKSIEMLNIIFKNRVVDLGAVFNWSNINKNIEQLGEKSDTNLSSLYGSVESGISSVIENFIFFD